MNIWPGNEASRANVKQMTFFFMYLAIEMWMVLQLVLNYLSQTEASLSRTHF